MTLLTGKIEDSGGAGLTGTLRVTLDAPLIDTSSSPDTLLLPRSKDFAVANGLLSGVDLTESATRNITYRLEFFTTLSTTSYYFADGGLYVGPKHFHTDNNWYTGPAHTDESRLLFESSETRTETLLDFRAIVPNQSACEFTALLPTGITTDILDTSLRRLAELLTSNIDFVEALRGGPRFKGGYNSDIYYQRDDGVTYGGSLWIWINDNPGTNKTPSVAGDGPTYWMLAAKQGDPGGTGGQDTAYDATGWNGAAWAPSANAVRDIIEQLVRTSQLAAYAPINSPTFTGNPSRTSNPLSIDRSTQLATTQWTGAIFAPLDSPVFTGNPAVPTQPLGDYSGKAASTKWVVDFLTSNGLLP